MHDRSNDFYWTWTMEDFYSPEAPEDTLEAVGPYTVEDLEFLRNAREREAVNDLYWTSDDPNSGR